MIKQVNSNHSIHDRIIIKATTIIDERGSLSVLENAQAFGPYQNVVYMRKFTVKAVLQHS